MRLFLLLSLIPLAYSSGFLELRLKSAFPLNATVEILEDIYFPTNKRVYQVPLVPNELRIITNLHVKFHRPGTVLVNSGPVDKFGLHYETIRSDRWNTQVMTISPPKIHLPFIGFRIDILCNRHWYGQQCDKFCNDDYAETINRRCTENGTIGCLDGFHGPNCDQPIDQNMCNCVNDGNCVSSFPSVLETENILICECPIGWEGEKCEKKEYEYAVPISVDMHGGGKKWTLLNQFFNRSLVDNELY